MSKDGGDIASLISMENSHFYRTALYVTNCNIFSHQMACKRRTTQGMSWELHPFPWDNVPAKIVDSTDVS